METVFKKIIDFETFREFCKYRVDKICLNEDTDGSCNKPDKRNMKKCPLWRLLHVEKRLENEEWIDKVPRKRSIKKFREEEVGESC